MTGPARPRCQVASAVCRGTFGFLGAESLPGGILGALVGGVSAAVACRPTRLINPPALTCRDERRGEYCQRRSRRAGRYAPHAPISRATPAGRPADGRWPMVGIAPLPPLVGEWRADCPTVTPAAPSVKLHENTHARWTWSARDCWRRGIQEGRLRLGRQLGGNRL